MLNLHGTCFGRKINWAIQKKNAKMKALNLETKNQARDQGIIQLKD